jgi:hypothetical protein
MNPTTDVRKGIVSGAFGMLAAETGGQSGQTERTDATEQTDAGSEPPRSGGDVGGPAPDEGSEEGDTEGLPLDQVFETLKNSRRRQTLHYLNDNGGEASLSDLAEHIAAIENDVGVEAITSSQRKRVYVGLYQCHLPKMDDMNIIDFEKNRGTVELARNAAQLEPYLEENESSAWYRLYGGVTAAGVGLFGVSALGSAPFGLTPATVLGALLLVMALCSVCHLYVEEIRDAE